MSRIGEVSRTTKETSVTLDARPRRDGRGATSTTPVGFLSHMLEAVAKHARFDLVVRASGDMHVDAHHTVEDVGLAFGEALDRALGDRAGIERFGDALRPARRGARAVASSTSRGARTSSSSRRSTRSSSS